jgi:hypothetical protein
MLVADQAGGRSWQTRAGGLLMQAKLTLVHPDGSVSTCTSGGGALRRDGVIAAPMRGCSYVKPSRGGSFPASVTASERRVVDPADGDARRRCRDVGRRHNRPRPTHAPLPRRGTRGSTLAAPRSRSSQANASRVLTSGALEIRLQRRALRACHVEVRTDGSVHAWSSV